MTIKVFNNGNINCKLDGTETQNETLLVNLLWDLFDNNCDILGDEYFIGNFTMALDLYNYYNNTIITIIYSELEKLAHGKTVKLYARQPNANDLENINKIMED